MSFSCAIVSRILTRRSRASNDPVALRHLHTAENKKAGVAEHPEVFDHAGLLVDEPSSKGGVLFIQSSDHNVPIRSHSPVLHYFILYFEFDKARGLLLFGLLLFLLRFAERRRFGQGKEHDLLTGYGADIVVQAHHLGACGFQDHCFHAAATGAAPAGISAGAGAGTAAARGRGRRRVRWRHRAVSASGAVTVR